MYKKINIILIIIIILFGINTLFGILGKIAIRNNNFKQANIFLNIAFNKELLGLIYYKQDDFIKAFNYFKKRDDWSGMGWAYFGMGKYEDAQDYFKRVNDLSGLGQVKLAQGKYREAREIFTENNEFSGIGLTYLIDNNYKNAADYFTKASDSFGLGLTYFCKGDFESAKKIFLNINNKLVRGIEHLMSCDYKNAKLVFEGLKDNNILASFYKAAGNYEEAVKLYINKSNYLALGRLFLSNYRLSSAYDLFSRKEDALGLEGMGDIYCALGDYRRAYELYDKSQKYYKAVTALKLAGNIDEALQYGQKILQKSYDENLSVLLTDILLRSPTKYKNFDYMFQKLQNVPTIKAHSLLLKCRFDLLDNNDKNISMQLQEAVNASGKGYYAENIIRAGHLFGTELTLPQSEIIDVHDRNKQGKFKVIIIVSLIIIIITAGVFFVIRRRVSNELKLEDVQIGYKGSKTPFANKKSKTDITSLKLSSISKLKEKSISTPTEELSKVISASEPSQGLPPSSAPVTEEKLEKSGVQILQLALKQIGVLSSAMELLELAGEGSSHLTVYGIYLASRSKGVQVQGIKVDLEYLFDNTKGTHLVFFHDETFALLKSITKESVELNYGVKESQTFTLEKFKQIWNGYVITLSKK